MSENQPLDNESEEVNVVNVVTNFEALEIEADPLQLREDLAVALDLIEQLKQVNEEQRAQIERLQKDRIRKSVVMQAPLINIPEEPAMVGPSEVSKQATEADQSTKIELFFKQFHTENVTPAQLSIHGINSLVSLHQIQYAKKQSDIVEPGVDEQSSTERAAKLAFNYVLEFIRQLNASQIDKKESVDLSYPINWLLSLFPYNIYTDKDTGEEVNDLLWMPLHFAVALDSSSGSFDRDSYLADLELLLEEFGHTAFAEDVSPLSVAVSMARPNLDVVKLILEYRPESVRKIDEDGSLPLMHACANNVTLDVIEYLYEQYPAALKVTDSFGCAAIHYAAFYGCPETVSFLLGVDPACANMVEGNGALPLHDAVQNMRGFGSTEMVEILLQANPQAVRKRDDYGAFPLHKAAKSATLSVVQLVHKAFPKAIFGPDIEGLLPMHYYAERHDKDQHLDLLQYVLQANPQSVAQDDTTLFAADPDPTAAAASGGWRGAMRAMWGGSTTAAKPATPAPPAPPPSAATVSSTAKFGAGGKATPPPAAHNKRKSVRPVRGSIHEQYKR